MSEKINIRYLKALFLQIIEGAYERTENNMSQFDRHIKEFKGMLNNLKKSDKEDFLIGLRHALIFVHQNPDKVEVAKIINEVMDIYMIASDCELLIRRIYYLLYDEEIADQVGYNSCVLVDEIIPYW